MNHVLSQLMSYKARMARIRLVNAAELEKAYIVLAELERFATTQLNVEHDEWEADHIIPSQSTPNRYLNEQNKTVS